MSLYLVATATGEHEIPTAHVLSWVRGYLASMIDHGGVEAAGSAELALSEMSPVPGETISQACYRALKVCHDARILTYRGIRRK